MVRKNVEKSTIKKSCAFSRMGLTKNIEVFVVMPDGWSIQQSYFSILMRVTWSDSVIYSSLAENLLNEFFYHHKNSKQKKHLIFHMLPWKKESSIGKYFNPLVWGLRDKQSNHFFTLPSTRNPLRIQCARWRVRAKKTEPILLMMMMTTSLIMDFLIYGLISSFCPDHTEA